MSVSGSVKARGIALAEENIADEVIITLEVIADEAIINKKA